MTFLKTCYQTLVLVALELYVSIVISDWDLPMLAMGLWYLVH